MGAIDVRIRAHGLLAYADGWLIDLVRGLTQARREAQGERGNRQQR
jgi:hypothetical protein